MVFKAKNFVKSIFVDSPLSIMRHIIDWPGGCITLCSGGGKWFFKTVISVI